MNHLRKAHELATHARTRAHVPYSHFAVGAAAKLRDSDQIVTGCNIENASFGATVCAERNAIFKAVCEHGSVGFEFMVVVTEEQPPAVPCALCLQVMAEFCDPEMEIHLATPREILRTLRFRELLPHPFTTFEAE